MSWIDGLREKLRPLLDRAGLEAELDEELAFHYEREVEAGLAEGMSPREARRAARASMGGAVGPAEDARAVWTGLELGGLGREVKLGLRRLRRRPGFAAVAILTLALGIGANTAIFSLVRSVLLRPLPYPAADRLAFIWSADREVESWLSQRELIEYRKATRSFDGLAAYTDFEATLTEDAEPERVLAAAVTGNALSVLGVRPPLGRGFRAEEDLPGADPVVLLSHELWQRRYGGDRGILGRAITTNGQRATVVGVLPPGFRLPLDFRLERPTELFVPAAIDEAADLPWGDRSYFIFGRLAPGATPRSATADLRAVAARWIREGLVEERQMDTTRVALPLDELLLADVRGPLFILMGAVGLILLIACANVANLLLARSESRRCDVAVSAALGASPRRLARQHLVENGLLAAVGAALGVGLAALGLRVAVALTPVTLIRMRGVELDASVLGFAALLTVGTTLLVGLVPAFRLSRVSLVAALGGARGPGRAGGRRWVRRWLVAAETALAVVLVIGAALLARSFAELTDVELGFDPSNVLTAGITLPASSHPESEQVGAFFRELIDRVERQPGVESAAAVRLPPLGPSIGSWSITLEDPPPDPDGNVEPDWQIVTPGYFETMRIELREGRFPTEADRAGGRLIAVISQAMADRYWPGGSPIGSRFHLGTADQPWVEIVGVAGRVRHNALLEEARVEMYLPHEQWPEMRGDGMPRRTMSLVVRTAGDPLDVVPAVRRELRELDPSIPLADPRPMTRIADGALAEERFTTWLVGLFAGLALALAAVGLYGVTAYSTSRRADELRIRMALGARRLDVTGLVVREALQVAAIGVLAGGLAAIWLTRLLAGQLYAISPLDPGTFTAVPLFLLAVAGLAAYLPARRAARSDPAVALRYDG